MMKVILVDDEQALLSELGRMLQGYGDIEVVGAYTEPSQALLEISETQPDCAFLDIQMGGINGIDLAERLSEKHPDMDILFVTAYNHYAAQAFEVNAIDYLLKPIRPERLAKALDKIHRRRRMVVLLPHVPIGLVRIQSLGSFQVFVGDEPFKWNRAKQRELFAYLLQHEGQWVGKFRLCDELWRECEPERALANLQTAIWAIRKSVKEAGSSQIRIAFSHDSYLLRLSDVQWDAREFDAAYKAFHSTGSIELGRKAAELYTGEYLSGEDWLWADLTRERYARQYEDLSKRLSSSDSKDR
jgi:two-component SAPR family response regulator